MNRPSARTAAFAAAWVAAGAIGATAITGFAFAASNNAPAGSMPMGANPTATQPPPTGMPDGPGMMGKRGGPGRGMGPGGMGLGGPGGPVLHGDLVVKGKDGVVRTVRVQSGVVTAASSASISVKSSDGFTSTWTLNADTKIRRDRADATADKIAAGDTVMVRGEVVSGTATAKMVRALSPAGLAQEQKNRTQKQQQRKGQGPPPAGSQAPSTNGASDDLPMDMMGI